ncbi:MAG: hypothetical protein N2167_01885 [Flavobacteriales bacterium]|nr:hypothetical protein [Flavobacteriales bacterium]
MKRLIILIFSLVVYTSAKCQIKTAQAYYDYVIDRLTQAVGNDTILAHALVELDYKKADSARKILLSQIENSYKTLKQLEPYNNKDQALRDATCDLLFFYKTVFENDYARLVEILSHAAFGVLPDKELDEFSEILNSIDRREKIIVGEFEQSRKEFIKEYKIKIQ